jgi:hypothetical protein
MSSHKKHEHLNQIKDAINSSKELDETQKSETIKHIDEWILEDKADGTLAQELINIASGIRPILAELGLM